MPEIVVAPAQTDEQLEACYRLAYEVFCVEMGTMRENADHTRRILCDDLIRRATVFCAHVDGVFAGTLGVVVGDDEIPFADFFESGFNIPRFQHWVPRSKMAILIRFLVKEEFRSSVLPFRLITEAARLCVELGLKLGFCDCQPHLLNLYQSLGFRACGPAFDQHGFGVMVPLVFNMADPEYLRAIRSPMYRYFGSKVKPEPWLIGAIEGITSDAAPVAGVEDLEGEVWSETYALLSRTRARATAFEGFTEEELSAFLERGQILECAAGQQVILEGQGTRTAFVILEGEAEVRLNGQRLARLGEGEMFGEFAFLLATKRTADVVAASDRIRLLVLDERTMQRVLSTRPELAAKLLWNMSRALALRLVDRSK